LRGELGGVVEQINQNLFKITFVGVNLLHGRVKKGAHLQPFLLDQIGHQAQARQAHLFDVHKAKIEGHLAGLNARDVQNVIDDRQQMPTAFLNALDGFQLPRAQRPINALIEHLRKGQDSGQRRAELMACRGQEFVFGAHRLREFDIGRAQLGRPFLNALREQGPLFQQGGLSALTLRQLVLRLRVEPGIGDGDHRVIAERHQQGLILRGELTVKLVDRRQHADDLFTAAQRHGEHRSHQQAALLSNPRIVLGVRRQIADDLWDARSEHPPHNALSRRHPQAHDGIRRRAEDQVAGLRVRAQDSAAGSVY